MNRSELETGTSHVIQPMPQLSRREIFDRGEQDTLVAKPSMRTIDYSQRESSINPITGVMSEKKVQARLKPIAGID